MKKGKQEAYAFDDDERDEILKRFRNDRKKSTATVLPAPADEPIPGAGETIEPPAEGSVTQGGVNISRFKGLGEMNPEQLWSTTMNPETRTILQVSIENAADADRTFSILMVV